MKHIQDQLVSSLDYVQNVMHSKLKEKLKDDKIKSLEMQEKKVGKSVKNSVRKTYLTFDKYLESLALTAGH